MRAAVRHENDGTEIPRNNYAKAKMSPRSVVIYALILAGICALAWTPIKRRLAVSEEKLRSEKTAGNKREIGIADNAPTWTSPPIAKPEKVTDPDADNSFNPRKVEIAIRALRAWIVDTSVPQPVRTEKIGMILLAQSSMRDALWSRYVYYLYYIWLTKPEQEYINQLHYKDPEGLAPTSSLAEFQKVGDLEGVLPHEWKGSFTIKGYTPEGVKALQIAVGNDIRKRLQERVQSQSASIKKGMRPEAVPNGYIKEVDDFLIRWWDGLPKPIPTKRKPPAKKR